MEVRPLTARRLVAIAAGLLCLLVTPAAGQDLADYDYEDLQFRGIGLEAGRIWPARVVPASYFGIRADLGFIGPRVRIVPSIRYWSSTVREVDLNQFATQIIEVCERQEGATCPEELDLGEVKLSDLELSTDAQFLLLTDRPVAPFLGFSVGLHLLNGRGDFIDDTFVEDLLDSVAPGLGPLVGVNFRMGAFEIGVESRFILASDARYAGVGGIGTWSLPAPPAGSAPVVVP